MDFDKLTKADKDSLCKGIEEYLNKALAPTVVDVNSLAADAEANAGDTIKVDFAETAFRDVRVLLTPRKDKQTRQVGEFLNTYMVPGYSWELQQCRAQKVTGIGERLWRGQVGQPFVAQAELLPELERLFRTEIIWQRQRELNLLAGNFASAGAPELLESRPVKDMPEVQTEAIPLLPLRAGEQVPHPEGSVLIGGHPISAVEVKR